MAEAEAGLELPIGLTERKLMQQLARIEAKIIKAAQKGEQAFVKGNKGIADSFKTAESSAEIFTRELDAMRTKFDPIYAASKRYEMALDELNRAHKLGVINAKQHEAALERLSREMLSANQAGSPFAPISKGMSGAARANIQNVSYQLQDFFVQVTNGTSASRALGQQVPQLLGGFGALGAAIGVVAAIGFPLAGMLFSSAASADDLNKSIDDLNSSLEAYKSAVADTTSSTLELAERYGLARHQAQSLLEIISQISRVEAATALRKSADAVASAFDGLIERVAQYDQLTGTDLGGNLSAGLETARGRLETLTSKFGLSIAQAQELADLLQDQQTAVTLDEQAAAIQNIALWLGDAAEAANYQNDALNSATKSAAEAARAALELKETTQDAERAASGLSVTIGGISFAAAISGAGALSSRIGGMIGQARELMSALGQAQMKNLAADERRELVELERDLVTSGKNRVEIEGQIAAARKRQELDASGVNIPALRNKLIDDARATAEATQSASEEINAYNKSVAEAAREAAKGPAKGGAKGGGAEAGAGRKEKTERPFFEDVEKDLIAIERQIALLGKSNEEMAVAKARWELLDEAKKRGLPVNEALNAQIEQQAAQVGRLTGELERAEIAQDQFDQAIDGVADAMAGALLAGESLRDGLAQVFKQIAADILNSGIRNALGSVFGAGGGSGFNLMSLFGGGGDPLAGALRGAGLNAMPSFDGGGYTGMAARSGGLDGKGGFLAMMHPNETVLDHSKGQSGAGPVTFAPSIVVNGDASERTLGLINAALAQERSRFFSRYKQAQAQDGRRLL